jgi:hypothetical protein
MKWQIGSKVVDTRSGDPATVADYGDPVARVCWVEYTNSSHGAWVYEELLVPDLLAALEQSIADAKAARQARQAGGAA